MRFVQEKHLVRVTLFKLSQSYSMFTRSLYANKVAIPVHRPSGPDISTYHPELFASIWGLRNTLWACYLKFITQLHDLNSL